MVAQDRSSAALPRLLQTLAMAGAWAARHGCQRKQDPAPRLSQCCVDQRSRQAVMAAGGLMEVAGHLVEMLHVGLLRVLRLLRCRSLPYKLVLIASLDPASHCLTRTPALRGAWSIGAWAHERLGSALLSASIRAATCFPIMPRLPLLASVDDCLVPRDGHGWGSLHRGAVGSAACSHDAISILFCCILKLWRGSSAMPCV